MKSLQFVAFATGGASLVLLGCGGGSSTGGAVSSSEASQTAKLGELSLTFTGKIQPRVDQGANGVTVSSAAGASFSTVALFPAKTLANTKIAYSLDGDLHLITNGVSNQITTGTNVYAYEPAWSPSGALYFPGYDGATGKIQLYTCLPDGSGFTKITNLSSANPTARAVSVAPNGSKIAYSATDGGIYTVNINGTSPTLLESSGSKPAYSPDGSKIVYLGGNGNILIAPSTGGTPTTLLTVSSGIFYDNPVWTPSGKLIAVTFIDSGASTINYVQAFDGGGYEQFKQPSGAYDSNPSFSPDGTEIAFLRGTSAESYQAAITIADTTGQNYQTIFTPQLSPSDPVAPAWSQFPTAREFVGSGGSMYTTPSSGFLYGQVNNSFASLVSFTATTSTKATITAQTGNSGPLVYTISADNLTGLKYTNAYIGAVVSILPYSGISATSALVSFNGSTGLVSTVAPFIAIKGSKAVRLGANLVYNEKFLGIYDGRGKNLAPNGASNLVLDASKGKLVSFK